MHEWLGEVTSDAGARVTPLPGVAPAKVIENVDSTGQGRVQLELPWLEGIQPWARLATPGAGGERGFYMIPQKGDEVLVGFTHGDIREPYVIGSLWSNADPPPYQTPDAPVSTRAIKTPEGHLIEFHDVQKTIKIQAISGHQIELSPDEILISTDGSSAVIQLGADGSISIKGTTLKCEAQEISMKGANVNIEGSASVQIKAGATCEIQGGMVKIN